MIGLCLFAISLHIVFCIERAENTYDEVKIDIHGLHQNKSFICFVAETESGPTVMQWYLAPMFGKGTMHPDSCSISFFLDRKSPRSFRGNVQWIHLQRIGVLIKTADGEWNVTWFSSDNAELNGHSLLFGGGGVAIDFANADETEPVSVEQLTKLGMDYSLIRD